ncbi:MAG TPA: winged helix-turn-helix transcriptional regulator [Anaerolineales bacterium]|nr:winged helix-turn-helix transcriptional regulator [Anaerolineales bacterium]HNA88169.1 winged helix-turn-helix transcriptional regulator [Anaerolineales bacterium]HNB36256.1 winged helix-turn-helix transcriptional regulator [Anaerolineales bacterium]HNC08969.1 winged helix-turn-helix transcriptional regulator [Anaerolineales bacterium]
MKSTRDKILQTLLKKPRSTINELAEVVGINPISVRHHLTNLQMEGLVSSQEERHGVGRPRLVYVLTNEGMERFPTRYLQLTTRLLTQMKESMPGPMVNKLFGQIAEDLASEYIQDIKGLSMEQRLDLIKDLLAQEGFTVEWEKKNGQYQIHEISCPYYQIGVTHPEVCTVDQTLISKMLALPANKVQCILNGNAHCTYVIQPHSKTK